MVVIPLALIALCVPLILRKVPRNRFYGFRTARTLSSDAVWYPANRIAGTALVWAGLIWLVGGLTIPLIAPPADARAWSLTIGLMALGLAMVVSFLGLRRLQR